MEMEKEFLEPRPQPREKQQISVPYLWEEKPGTPKKEWSSRAIPMISFPSPATLVVSIPFEWEERPGKPIQVTETVPDLLTPSSLPGLDVLPASDHYPNPFVDEKARHLNPFMDETEGGAIASDLEAFSFKMNDDIFGLTTDHQSLPVLTAAQESFSENDSYWNENWHSASETDGHSSSSSSAAENVGTDTSVIEFLFPLSSPGTSSRNNYCRKDKAPSPMAACPDSLLTNDCSGKRNPLARRTLTLGELILLSRQLSCRRKEIDVKKRNHPKEYIKKSLLTCFPFVINGNKSSAFISSW